MTKMDRCTHARVHGTWWRRGRTLAFVVAALVLIPTASYALTPGTSFLMTPTWPDASHPRIRS
jgi:hypothetical protein